MFDSRGWCWVVDEGWEIPKVFYPLSKVFSPLRCWRKKIEIERVVSSSESITDDLETLKKGWNFSRKIERSYFWSIFCPFLGVFIFQTSVRKKIVTSRIHLWCSFLFLEMWFMMFLHWWRQSGGEILNILVCHGSIFLMWYSNFLNIQRWYFQIFHFHSINDYRIDTQTEDNIQNRR